MWAECYWTVLNLVVAVSIRPQPTDHFGFAVQFICQPLGGVEKARTTRRPNLSLPVTIHTLLQGEALCRDVRLCRVTTRTTRSFFGVVANWTQQVVTQGSQRFVDKWLFKLWTVLELLTGIPNLSNLQVACCSSISTLTTNQMIQIQIKYLAPVQLNK